jgi:hypothetical protein
MKFKFLESFVALLKADNDSERKGSEVSLQHLIPVLQFYGYPVEYVQSVKKQILSDIHLYTSEPTEENRSLLKHYLVDFSLMITDESPAVNHVSVQDNKQVTR